MALKLSRMWEQVEMSLQSWAWAMRRVRQVVMESVEERRAAISGWAIQRDRDSTVQPKASAISRREWFALPIALKRRGSCSGVGVMGVGREGVDTGAEYGI